MQPSCRATPESPAQSEVRLADIISSLSYALDLTEGQPPGHSVGTCILGMRLAEELELPAADRADLYYALLLKDAGCSANASRMCQIFGSDERQAKLQVKTTDWTRVSLESLLYLFHNAGPGESLLRRWWRIGKIAAGRHRNSRALFSMRCERGANVARKIGFSERTAHAIHCLDEHWDGGGYPQNLRGNQIPLLAQIAGLCQTLEVYARACGPGAAIAIMRERSGTWFSPELVRAAAHLEGDEQLWRNILSPSIAMSIVNDLDPGAA